MSARPPGLPPWVRQHETEEPPLPGQKALVSAGLATGILLLGCQLWMLTVALDLLLAGHGELIWIAALVSGAIFAGGLLMLWVLKRRPHVHRLTTDESGKVIRRYEHPDDAGPA